MEGTIPFESDPGNVVHQDSKMYVIKSFISGISTFPKLTNLDTYLRHCLVYLFKSVHL